MENIHIGTAQFVWLILGAVIFITVPVAVAIIWKIRKKEPVLPILTGAAVFLLFALILEKPIQNVLLFPTALGLPDHAVSGFLGAHPVLLALLAGLFPGVFEETGRFVAFKTVLKNRKNRETSISYGIGHGGFEVMLLLGIAFVEYIVFAVMINTGLFGSIVDQVAAQAPDQVGALEATANTIASFSLSDLCLAALERVFAVLFHIGASVLVFYACRDKGRFWLFPFAVVLHTAMDFVAALYSLNVVGMPAWALECVVAAFGAGTFFAAYFLLYKKDKGIQVDDPAQSKNNEM